MGQLRTIQEELVDLGYQIVAVSADRPEKLSATVDKNSLTYQLVSDATQEGATAFGLAFRDEQALQGSQRFRNLLEEASGRDHHTLPVPAVYLIGSDGIVDFLYVNPDHRVRLAPEILLAAARVHSEK